MRDLSTHTQFRHMAMLLSNYNHKKHGGDVFTSEHYPMDSTSNIGRVHQNDKAAKNDHATCLY